MTAQPPSHPVLPARRVYEILRRRVDGGQYQPGAKLPTERELGEELGVSRITVAKAMAQLVAEDKVLRFRGRGTFVRSDTASDGDGTRRTGRRITFISPGREGQTIVIRHGILEGMHEVLHEAGYYVGVDFYGNLDEHLECLQRYQRPESAAFAIWPEPNLQARALVERMLGDGFPAVLVDTYFRDLDCDYVASDNVEGAAMMVAHLAELGHRRIVYIGEPPVRTSTLDRLTGFIRGMVQAGLPLEQGSVAQVSSDAPEEVMTTVRRVLEMQPAPTALFCSHDYLAVAAYGALRELGVRVPDDVSLAGYDNIDLAEKFVLPLTTIRQDYLRMGRVAGQILLDRLEGRSIVRYQSLIPPQLIVRRSTAELNHHSQTQTK